MSNSSMRDFTGSGSLFLKNVFLYVLVTAPGVSFCLMGAKWAYIFSTMVILSLPFAALAAVMVSRFDGFSFDDAQQQFRRPVRNGVPYRGVTRIDINETGRLVQVRLKQGRVRSTSLVYALDNKDKNRFIEELRKRLPDVTLRERRHVDWKSIAVILTVIVLLTGGFHFYWHRNYSEFGVVPKQAPWAAQLQKPKKAQQYDVGPFLITMHKRFQVTGRDEGALQLEDRKTKTELQFVVGRQKSVFGQKAAVLPSAIGIHDYYDVLETAYAARVGVVPLVLKMLALSNLSEVSIYDIRQPVPSSRIGEGAEGKEASPILSPELKGFATQGRKKDKEVVSILLVDTKRKADMYIFISAPHRLSEKILQEIVAGVGFRPVPAR